MRLADKVALVTGAGRGIGRGIATALAGEGATVVINFPTEPAEAEQVVAEIAAGRGQSVAIKADIANSAERDAVFEQVRRRFGRLDILVNNAAFDPDTVGLLEVDERLYDHVLQVNLKGAFFCAQSAARLMIEVGRGGRIINISSVHGQQSLPGHAPYSLSKGGLDALTRQAAVDLAPHRITVNGIAPGFIEVARTIANFPQYSREAIAERIPLQRVGFPEDIAALAVFLASDESSFLTGQVIPCDGGTLALMSLHR